jgi:hypothetical protein
MKGHPILDKDGRQIGIACSRVRRPKRCGWCSAEGTLLCDGVTSTPGVTCDAPICREHAKHVGRDRDLCPDCVVKVKASIIPVGDRKEVP